MNQADVVAALISAGIALVAGVLSGPTLIAWLYRLKYGQSIRTDGPQSHLKKAGTPTMGGFLIWFALLVSLACQRIFSPMVGCLLLVTLGHATLGYLDDYIKAVRKNPDGLSARAKLIGQFTLAGLFYALLLASEPQTIHIPIVNLEWHMGVLYPCFVVLYMVFFSNAVNFADGIDGLNGGLCIIFSLICMVVAFAQGQQYLALLAAALVGALVSFLVFNLHPAKLFMGDTGSLGLGAILAGMALLLRQEFALLFAGIVFLAEMLSVIIQVLYFKRTGGKRFFRMAPIHHHFELLGWSEWRIDFTFWGIAGLASLVAYTLLI